VKSHKSLTAMIPTNTLKHYVIDKQSLMQFLFVCLIGYRQFCLLCYVFCILIEIVVSLSGLIPKCVNMVTGLSVDCMSSTKV
jgi:hypothetical protein